MVTPVASLVPSRTGEPATQMPEACALAARTPSVVLPDPGGSAMARFSTRPMPPTPWRAAISSPGVATVVADDVLALMPPDGTPRGVGRLSRPVALDTHGLPDAVTGLTAGLPANELETALALHCHVGCA